MSKRKTSFDNPMAWSRMPWYLVGVELVELENGETRHVERGPLVKPGSLQLFFVLMTFADSDEEERVGRCYPSIGRLAKALNVTTRCVKSRLRELETVGAVRVLPAFGRPDGREHGRDDGRQTTNTYELAFDQPFGLDERTNGRNESGQGGTDLHPGGERDFIGEDERGFTPELEQVNELDPDQLEESLHTSSGASSSGVNEISPYRGVNEISPLGVGAQAQEGEIEF